MEFLDKTCLIEYFGFKTEGINITMKFRTFKLVQVPNLSNNRHFKLFGPKVFRFKKEKVKIAIEFNTFELFFVRNFNLDRQV